jgi:hypothetical protein
MGLLAEEDMKNPVIWIKERLKRFFTNSWRVWEFSR